MEILTILTENMQETAALLKEALAKEKYLLQNGIEKTRARIRQFEQRYSANLAQILSQGGDIDHVDLAEWEGEEEVLRRLMKKIQNLEQIQICT